MAHDEQTEEGTKKKHEQIFYSKLLGSKNGEKLAIKFTRSANIYDFVFLFSLNIILLLLLRMQKSRFDAVDRQF